MADDESFFLSQIFSPVIPATRRYFVSCTLGCDIIVSVSLNGNLDVCVNTPHFHVVNTLTIGVTFARLYSARARISGYLLIKRDTSIINCNYNIIVYGIFCVPRI